MGDRDDPSSPIAKLNEGLKVFEGFIKNNEKARKSVEVSVVTFGGSVQVSDFVQARDFEAPVLDGYGETPMCEGIMTALQKIRQRKDEIRSRGESYYRPWLFLLTDGEPTDGKKIMNTADALQQAHEGNNAVSYFAGIGDDVNWEVLNTLSPKHTKDAKDGRHKKGDFVNSPLEVINEGALIELFKWLEASMTIVAASGEDTDAAALPPVSGWAIAPTR
jgi:uncharacterized protein YegL